MADYHSGTDKPDKLHPHNCSCVACTGVAHPQARFDALRPKVCKTHHPIPCKCMTYGEDFNTVLFNADKATRPTQHPLEMLYPNQTTEFKAIIDKMYQLHLKKNMDYSPMNIKATGMVGLATRIWDKTARILNLVGFDVQSGEYRAPKAAMNESIEDSLIDLANYAVIALIHRKGKWGN
jgi:hypothetical protein